PSDKLSRSLHDALPICFECRVVHRNRGSAACSQTSAQACAIIADSRPRRRKSQPKKSPATPLPSRTWAKRPGVAGKSVSAAGRRSEEHTSELQSLRHLV